MTERQNLPRNQVQWHRDEVRNGYEMLVPRPPVGKIVSPNLIIAPAPPPTLGQQIEKVLREIDANRSK